MRYHDDEGYRLVVQAIEKDEMDRLLLGDGYYYKPEREQCEAGPIDHDALLKRAIYPCAERRPELDVRTCLERAMEGILGSYKGLHIVAAMVDFESANRWYRGPTPLNLDAEKWALRIRDVVRGRDAELREFKDPAITGINPDGLLGVLRARSFHLEKRGCPGFFDDPTDPTTLPFL